MTNKTISRALISVSDKTGLLALARTLAGLKVEILSTGGSASLLEENDISVTRVSEFTGQEEIMDGRVKTLHPKIHGGILARRDQDQEIMHEQGISGIDLVVVNLYPFSHTIAQPNCSFEDAIENIDIGGPTMVRAAAKNHHDVVIITDPSDYEQLSETLTKNNTATDDAFRFKMAAKAFAHTAAYDAAISQYLNAKMDASQADAEKQTAAFPAQWQMSFTLSESLRYGENPHQQAAFYHQQTIPAGSISAAKQVQGKALSFNNIADADTALECVKQFDQPACVIVKHANPCGAAQADTVLNAYQLAFATDKESAFGGIIAINKTLEADLAQAIIDQQFVEVIIAPDISAAAQKVLQAKANVRALVCGEMTLGSMQEDIKRVNGGLLVQSADAALYDALTVATKTQPTEQQLLDCEFAFKVAKFVKSNAIVYANKNQTIGVGAGQMSRINSARIASIKADHAGLQVAGSVMASDAFFPFKDGIEQAAQDGIAAIIQPGGSIRDDEVIQAADDAGIAMVFTGMRHFRH